MLTYQDLTKVQNTDKDRIQFIQTAISQHKASTQYKFAKDAERYARGQNATIMRYQKLLYTISGKAVPDNFSANHKIPSKFFYRFVEQENQFLLGNGVQWSDKEGTERKIGTDFDSRLQEMGFNALVHGISFGFFDVDKVKVFSILEFIPLWDETNGALRAGIRFWQIDATKPVRATLYEEDGYTEYTWGGSNNIEDSVVQEKTSYKLIGVKTGAGDIEIRDGMNYDSFPIVPMYGNKLKQSKLVGLREQIDSYDLIKSGFASDLDDCSQIFWCLSNAQGMDDLDLATFVERMKTIHAFATSEDVKAEAHTIEVPYNAREKLLDRIRADLYEDAMALDTKSIVGGANTATQIKASYEPLNNETDAFEYCVLEFVNGILALAGVDEQPSFTRSYITNVVEEVQTVVQASTFLTEEYVTTKLLNILGDGDKVDEILANKDVESFQRFNQQQPQEQPVIEE